MINAEYEQRASNLANVLRVVAERVWAKTAKLLTAEHIAVNKWFTKAGKLRAAKVRELSAACARWLPLLLSMTEEGGVDLDWITAELTKGQFETLDGAIEIFVMMSMSRALSIPYTEPVVRAVSPEFATAFTLGWNATTGEKSQEECVEELADAIRYAARDGDVKVLLTQISRAIDKRPTYYEDA